jgi:hypothetical protein
MDEDFPILIDVLSCGEPNSKELDMTFESYKQGLNIKARILVQIDLLKYKSDSMRIKAIRDMHFIRLRRILR